MKYMNMMKSWRIPMANLQLFADGDGGSDGDGGDGDGGTDGNEPEALDFDGFLKLEGNQAEFDRRVNKAIKTAVTNAEKKWKALTDDKLTEAEKLAQMTEVEKQAYEMKKLRDELETYKKQNVHSELAKTARQMLTDEGINIPDALLKNLVTDEADSTKEAVEAFADLYKEAVQDAVKEALKGKTPRKKGGDTAMTKEQIIAVKNPAERKRLIEENIELFQ
jgi:hypothetical protein